MKKTIKFNKFFLPAGIISCLLVLSGVSGYFLKDGFALGVDFQAGLVQEVRIAPAAFNLRWTGISNAIISFDRSGIYIVISGSGIENRTHSFPFAEYGTIGSLTQAMTQQLEELEVSLETQAAINSQWLIFSAQGNPYLNNETPYVVHYLNPQSAPIDISEIRNAMAGFGQGVSVQNIGSREDRHFMIRVEDEDEGHVRPEQITQTLETFFGKDQVAVIRSDYVSSRFSKDLTDQAAGLIGLTLLVIFIYVSFRFRPQYAIGAVVGIIHDALIIVGFLVWTQMEFTTSTIAAILTILGYSTNNTIVLFDRIRENRRIYPEHSFVDVINISLTNVLGRTIIMALTTMLTVMFLVIFVRGAMRDFAIALLIGMTSGTYTTLYISSGLVNFIEDIKIKRGKKKLVAA
jgi:preprotein translocase subunit SecF